MWYEEFKSDLFGNADVFRIAVRRYIRRYGPDAVEGLYGILNSNRFGITRKMRALASVLEIPHEIIPFEPRKVGCGPSAVGTYWRLRKLLGQAQRPDWARFLTPAYWLKVRRRQLQDRSEDWLLLPFRERVKLRSESQRASGWIITVPPVKYAYIVEQLQREKADLKKLISLANPTEAA